MRSSLIPLFAALIACSGGRGPADDDTGDTADTAQVTPPRRTFADLPDDAWSYVPVSDMVCADGSSGGVLVRPGQSDRLAVLLGGRRACDNSSACNEPRFWLALHVDPEVEISALQAQPVSQRLVQATQPDQPLAGATVVYVPYCTADLYIGNLDMVYDQFEPEKLTRHRGDELLQSALAQVRTEVDDPEQVWAIGWGAGGYGVQVQAHRFAETWPDASLAVLADSAPMIDGYPFEWSSRLMFWNPQFPPGCSDCDQGFSKVIRHQRQTLPSVRFGLAMFLSDPELYAYVDLTDIDRDASLTALVDANYSDERAAAFLVDGSENLVMGQPREIPAAITGAPFEPWFAAWANGGAAFQTER